MQPKVLLFDIETSPLITYSWQIYDADAIEVIEDWQILTFAFKWLGEKRTYVFGQDDYPGYKPGVNDDKKLVEALRDVFNQADVVVAHNGDRFDVRKAQARMMIHRLDPPTPYKTIDTKKVAKKYGAFTSNKLDDLNHGFGFRGKASTGGFALWKSVLAGDPKAWKKMKHYNKQDVIELEKLYLRLRPWIHNHPSLNLISGRLENCPNCNGGPVVRNGSYYSKVGRFQVYHCNNCGANPRMRLSENIAKPMYV